MAKEFQDYVSFNFDNGCGLSVYPGGESECRKLVEEVHRCFAEGKPFFHSKKHKFMIAEKDFRHCFVGRKLMEKDNG